MKILRRLKLKNNDKVHKCASLSSDVEIPSWTMLRKQKLHTSNGLENVIVINEPNAANKTRD